MGLVVLLGFDCDGLDCRVRWLVLFEIVGSCRAIGERGIV